MATYKNFFDASSALRIEVEGSAGTSNAYVGDAMAALESIATTIGSQINQLSKDQRPTEFSVTFGLKALAVGGFVISLSETNANFRITMKWGGNSNGLLGESMPTGPI